MSEFIKVALRDTLRVFKERLAANGFILDKNSYLNHAQPYQLSQILDTLGNIQEYAEEALAHLEPFAQEVLKEDALKDAGNILRDNGLDYALALQEAIGKAIEESKGK